MLPSSNLKILRFGWPIERTPEEDEYGMCICGELDSIHIFGIYFDNCFDKKDDVVNDFISRWADHFCPSFSLGINALAAKLPALQLAEVFLFDSEFTRSGHTNSDSGESFPYWSWRINQDPFSVSPAILLYEDGPPLFSSGGKAETFSRWTYNRGMAKRRFPTDAPSHTSS